MSVRIKKFFTQLSVICCVGLQGYNSSNIDVTIDFQKSLMALHDQKNYASRGTEFYDEWGAWNEQRYEELKEEYNES